METILATFLIVVLCAAGMGIGLFFKRKPLQKRCSSDPDQECDCQSRDCGGSEKSRDVKGVFNGTEKG